MEHLNDRHSPALALRALHHLELRLRGVPSLRDRAPAVYALRLAARLNAPPDQSGCGLLRAARPLSARALEVRPKLPEQHMPRAEADASD